MKTPWIAFYCHDLLQSQRWLRMSAEQQAVYINLLCTQAVSGPLPADLDDLAFLATRNTRGVSEERFHELWKPPLSDCFETTGEGLENPRMALEIAKARQRSEAGRKAVEARWIKGRDTGVDTGVSRPNSEGNRMTGQDMTVQDTPTESRGAAAPVPPEPKPKRRKKGMTLAEYLEEKPVEESWIVEMLERWSDYRGDLGGVAAWRSPKASWTTTVNKMRAFGEKASESVLDHSIGSGKYTGLFWDRAQPAASQAPSAGSWYKGPPLKGPEVREMESDIRIRMAQVAGDFMLPLEKAKEMARARNDRDMHKLDWMTGVRSDAPAAEEAK